jgi:uncharacterized protein YwqG
MSLPSIEWYVRSFAENSIKQNESIGKSAAEKNRYARREAKCFDALREIYGDQGREALSVLFDHEDPGVRLGAAAYLLRYKTDEAMKVLYELKDRKDLHWESYLAQCTLENWEKGYWQLDLVVKPDEEVPDTIESVEDELALHTDEESDENENRNTSSVLEQMKEDLLSEIHEHALSHLAADLEKMLQYSMVLEEEGAEDRELSIGATKFGGSPDVPPDFVWPTWQERQLSFLAQFNLAEIAEFDVEHRLPHAGLLSLFYDAQEQPMGLFASDRGAWRVYHFSTPLENLKRKPLPEELPEDVRFPTSRISYSVDMTLPDSVAWEIENLELTREERESYIDLKDANQTTVFPLHRLLGHPEIIQQEMRGDCQERFDPSDVEKPMEPTPEEIEQWRLLIQLDTNEETGMYWGNTGKLYFWIRECDLQARAFENVWLMLQCT